MCYLLQTVLPHLNSKPGQVIGHSHTDPWPDTIKTILHARNVFYLWEKNTHILTYYIFGSNLYISLCMRLMIQQLGSWIQLGYERSSLFICFYICTPIMDVAMIFTLGEGRGLSHRGAKTPKASRLCPIPTKFIWYFVWNNAFLCTFTQKYH